MSYEFYKVLHLVGVIMVIASLSAMIIGAWIQGSKQFPQRKMLATTHGIGLLVSLIAGFGTLVRLGITSPWPTWVYGKLLIWCVFGFYTLFVYRQPKRGALFFWGVIVLASVAGYLARMKIE